MTSVQTVVLLAYLLFLCPLALWGLHRGYLVYGFAKGQVPEPPPQPEEWPMVTVQLPLFNERYVAKRLLQVTSALDYPSDRLHIQVLDDSTDDTTDIVRQEVERLVALGVDIVLRHREDRTGFKAGALEEGLRVSKGEFVAVFDADFVPDSQFLKDMVPWFTEGIGMVQARWGHLNADATWLTDCQATLLDGHFVVEHSARFRNGRWFNFNGTAGIWRKRAIEEAGGWQHDTLTEDMDLSYRSQLAGWRFIYLVDVVAPAELPDTMAAFKTQQYRWAKGSVQVARKLLGTLLRAPIPVGHKIEALFHLLGNFAHPLVVGLSILLPLAVWARGQETSAPLLIIDLVFFLASLGSISIFYGTAIVRSGAGKPLSRILRIPVVFALGLGIALAQTRAVYDGLFGDVGVFVRTPKKGDSKATYRSQVHWGAVGEVVIALWLWVGLVAAALTGWYASMPFLAMFASGWALVGLHSLRDAFGGGESTAEVPAADAIAAK